MFGQTRAGFRTLLLMVFAIVVIVPSGMMTQAKPVEAGSRSCTGWESRRTPPNYIRVLVTQTGEVKKVRFKTYVAKVMASGEWPGRLHSQTLKAGAFATMQYAWYHSLKGKWRGGVSRGKCYDVVNTTNDQLFRPGARPVKSQWRAVNAVWGHTLWKWGTRFFLTGYRAGSTSVCAADAHGWKLYAKSAENCAKKRNWSWKRILKKYYSKSFFKISPALKAAQES